MLERLNAKEREALVELLVFMAKSDGRFLALEKEVLDSYSELIGIDWRQLPDDKPLNDLLDQFKSPAHKIILMQELIRLTLIDGVYDENERAEIAALGAELEMDADLLDDIEDWVIRGLEWMLEGEQMLEEAEASA